MLTLPPSPVRRAWLMSFWFAMSLFAGIFLGGLLAVALDSRWIAAAPLITLAIAVPGWRWPKIISFPYRAWNKLAREFASLARFWLLTVCYHAVLTPVARAGSSLRLAPPKPGESLWVPRETLAAQAYFQPGRGVAGAYSNRNWITSYLSCCVTSRNLWALCLLPFLILLSLLKTHQYKSSVPSNIYTLY